MTASPFVQKKQIRLSDCAELSLGYSFRGRIETAPDGQIAVIQMRDLTEANLVDAKDAARTKDYGYTPAHYLAPGDLVFRARGANNAAALAADLPERAALASPLVKIRTDTSIVDPHYLQWFINLPTSQAFIGSGLQGSLVRMVSIEHLARMHIVVPSLDTQKTIVGLASLYAREADLLRKIADLREGCGRFLIMERILGIDRRTYDD